MSVASANVVLYDASGNPLAVSDGATVPASSPGLLLLGKDEGGNAQVGLADSATSALIGMDALVHHAKLSPVNTTPSTTPLLTKTYWGHVSTSATSQVSVQDANAIVASLGASSTASFKVASTSANDTSAGTGVRTILITYLGTDDVVYYVSATMNGTTVVTVTLSVNAVAVLDVFLLTAGSGLGPAGTITVKESTATTTMGQIATGNAVRAAQTSVRVPQNRTVLVHGMRLSAKAVAGTFDLTLLSTVIATNVNGILYADRVRVAVGSVVPIIYNPPLSFAAPSGSRGLLNVKVTPDSTSAADYWAALDTSLI